MQVITATRREKNLNRGGERKACSHEPRSPIQCCSIDVWAAWEAAKSLSAIRTTLDWGAGFRIPSICFPQHISFKFISRGVVGYFRQQMLLRLRVSKAQRQLISFCVFRVVSSKGAVDPMNAHGLRISFSLRGRFRKFANQTYRPVTDPTEL